MRERFPFKVPKLVVCISHLTRIAVNAKLNAMLKPETGAVFVPKADQVDGSSMAPQDMYVWGGMTLVASCRQSRTVLNKCTYDVLEVTEASVTVRLSECFWKEPLLEDGTFGPAQAPSPLVLSLADASRLLRPFHATTYAGVQGRTFDFEVLLLDMDHRFMDMRKLMVACSRVTEGRLLGCATATEQRAFLG